MTTEPLGQPEIEREGPMSQQASPQGLEHTRLEHQSNLVEKQDQEGKEHDGKDLLSNHEDVEVS